MKKFETKLADPMCDGWSGFGSGPGCSPRDYATELLKTEIPGPWLFVYMFRRFGWPNVGGDPYKDIACWHLTTPIKGLGLLVSPHMGADGTRYDEKEKFNCCNLHFAVRFNEDIGNKIQQRGRRTTAFQLKAKRALQAAMKDLLRATNVRDISFTPFGDIERTPQAVEKFKHNGFCGYFKGAGMTPEYYFTKASEKEKAGED